MLVLCGDGLGERVLEGGSAVGADGAGDAEQVLGGETGDGDDGAGPGRSEATGDAWQAVRTPTMSECVIGCWDGRRPAYLSEGGERTRG